jgi:hypothetical protein
MRFVEDWMEGEVISLLSGYLANGDGGADADADTRFWVGERGK